MFRFPVRFAVVALAGVLACVPAFAQSPAVDSADISDSFLDRAIEMNYAEIQLAHLAIAKAQDERVREFARMLARDHTQVFDRLHGFAQQKAQVNGTVRQKPSVSTTDAADRSLLTTEHQESLDELAQFSGAAFDREFVDRIVEEHEHAIRWFEREAGMTDGDRAPTGRITPGASDWPRSADHDHITSTSATARVANDLLPAMRLHLAEAQRLQQHVRHSAKPTT